MKSSENINNKEIEGSYSKFISKHNSSKVFIAQKSVPFVVKNTYSKFKKEVLNKIKKDITILEVGCGTGIFTKMLLKEKNVKNIIATDISGDAIRISKKNIKNNKVKFEIANLEKLKYKDNSFDLVVGFEVLHHLNDVKSAVKESFRVSKNMVVFNEPNKHCPIRIFMEKFYYKPEEHETSFTSKELSQIFKKYAKHLQIIKYSFILTYINNKSFIKLNYRLSNILDKTFLRHIAASLLIIGEKS